MNRVLDHIYADLARPVSLSELAELADLSPFHFHRVFQAMIGETPNDFMKRLRLERAVYLMSFGKQSSLTSIALSCGFGSSSDFTRSFKQRYGVAPSKFDAMAWQAESGQRIQDAAEQSLFRLDKNPNRENPDHFRVKVREFPSRLVAYIRVSNPYQGDAVVKAAKRLIAVATDRNLDHGQWLGYQFESPKVTALERCYYCVAVEVQAECKLPSDVSFYRFPAMTVAEVEMKGGIDLEIRLLQWLYGSWLPRSNYVPDDQPCFEAWHGQPFQHGNSHFELSIHLPIRRFS